MRLLADENVARTLVVWLRETGQDVCWVNEDMKSALDEDILEAGANADRVLLTFDRDFGEHVFRHRARSAGVVFFRLDTRDVEQLMRIVKGWWNEIAEYAEDHFVVVTEKKLRVRPLPGGVR